MRAFLITIAAVLFSSGALAQASGQQLFFSGKLKVAGDPLLATVERNEDGDLAISPNGSVGGDQILGDVAAPADSAASYTYDALGNVLTVEAPRADPIR